MTSVSIVFRVKNEGRTLDQVLEGVKSQKFDGTPELLVVDSGSTDNTLAIAESRGCRIVHIRPEEFSWGFALNLGAEKAKGDYIVYLSGHCEPVDDRWLENLLSPFTDPAVGGVYSRHVPIPGVDPFEAVELESFWFPEREGGPVESGSFSNASCALSRKAWEAVRFDETILSCEDGDWASRARKAGWKIMYQPRSMVFHSHPPRLETIYLRWFWRCYTAKKILPFTREGGLAYLFFNMFRYGFLDLCYLVKTRRILRFWKIPFYELVRHIGGYNGARAANRGKKFKKWNDVRVPGWMEAIRGIVEG